ncbi:MAG: hypothetical protein RRX88_07105 [Raoultibacter sp.]
MEKGTVILIDYLGRKDPYCADAKKLLVMQVFGDADLCGWASGR